MVAVTGAEEWKVYFRMSEQSQAVYRWAPYIIGNITNASHRLNVLHGQSRLVDSCWNTGSKHKHNGV
jgi:hypothetical protein